MTKFFPILALIIFASCGSEDKKPTSLDKLIAERDSLKNLQKSYAERIRDLDARITAAGGNKGREGKALLVTTAEASKDIFEHFFEVQGQVEAEKSITLTAETGGAVKRIYVQEGQQVKAGQTIAELDREMIEQGLNEIREATELARFVYEKQEKLWKQNIGSELQYRQAKTNYESLLQRQRQLQTQRNKAFITAPFAGVVDEIFPKVGEMAGPGMPVARVVNLNELQVKANVSEKYVGKIQPGTKISIYFSSTGRDYTARLSKIGSYINPVSRTFEIAASIPNASSELLPNQVAEIRVRDYVNEDAVLVPSRAVLQDVNGNSFVYTVQRTRDVPQVRKVSITTGLSYNNLTEVLSGLEGIEEVVVEGVRSINDGDRVTITK